MIYYWGNEVDGEMVRFTFSGSGMPGVPAAARLLFRVPFLAGIDIEKVGPDVYENADIKKQISNERNSAAE